ncbi:MAG: hypothetical protein ACLP9C_05355 [Acidimicrobiales bacterium]
MSFVLGLIASIVGWWIIAVLLIPRLEVSELNRIPQPKDKHPCGYRYRVKVRNKSKMFTAADLSIQARFVVRGLDKNRPSSQTSILVPVGVEEQFSALTPCRRNRPSEDSERVYTIRIFEMRGNAIDRLPDGMRERLDGKSITLEEIFVELEKQCGSEPFIRLAVSASHGLSGFRRTYAKKFEGKESKAREGEFEEWSTQVLEGHKAVRL